MTMYTFENFQSKKALKEAVSQGKRVEVYQPNGDIFGNTGPFNGTVYLEGPHYPKPHKWYASATVKDSVIVPGTVK
jgi:hypothetical protein